MVCCVVVSVVVESCMTASAYSCPFVCDLLHTIPTDDLQISLSVSLSDSLSVPSYEVPPRGSSVCRVCLSFFPTALVSLDKWLFGGCSPFFVLELCYTRYIYGLIANCVLVMARRGNSLLCRCCG